MATYSVKPGDTLWGLAQRFHTTVGALAAANHLANPNVLMVGQKLNISSFNPTPVKPAAPARPKPAASTATTYKVRAGDTLGAIAKKFGTTVSALAKLNNLKNVNVIVVGQVLKLGTTKPTGAPTPVTSPTPTTPTNGNTIPANAKVAFIGDSHTAGVFGARLKSKLGNYLSNGGGALTTFKGVPSATTNNFLNGTQTNAGGTIFSTPSLASVLSKKPKVLVVALGTNQLSASKTWNKAQIRAVLKQADAAGTKVVWVGPPDVRGYSNEFVDGTREAAFYAALKEVNAERTAAGKKAMTIVDSRKYTNQNNTVDRVHFSGAAATKWADEVYQQLT